MAKILSISLILLAIIAITYGRSTGYKVDQLEFTNEAKTYERKDEAVNIGLNSNSEDDNTSEGITGDDSTGEDNTGEENTGEDNTGEGNTSEDNTGEGNTGEGDMEEDNTYGDEKIEDVIKRRVKEEFKTIKSELESIIDESKSELELVIEANKSELKSAIGEIAKNTASIKSSKDRITRLENKIQINNYTKTNTPESTKPESTTTATTTPETTTPKPKLSDKDRIAQCGLINSIEDDSITPSSVYWNYYGYGPEHSRLNSVSGRGGWLAYTPYEGQWIQIDMGTKKKVRGVATQGRSLRNYPDQWIKTYLIAFKTSTSSNFQYVQDPSGAKKIFQGNTDGNSVVINDVDVEARFIRIYPISWYWAPMLRFDILLC